MKILSMLIFAVLALIHILPLSGVLGGERLRDLYGIQAQGDLSILMRHRAVLFGLLSLISVLAAFKPEIRSMAALLLGLSMASFLVLAFLEAPFGAPVRKIVVADIVGLALLLTYLVMDFIKNRPPS